MYQKFTIFSDDKRRSRKILLLAFISFFSLSFFSTQVNAQTTLGLGDISFISYNSDVATPAGAGAHQFGFVTFTTVASGSQISFTDRGWTSSSGFSSSSPGESTITVTFNQTLNPGDQIYVDANGNVFNQNGTTVGTYTGTPLTLSTLGDQIFSYQGTEPTPANQSNFLTAIQMNGSWDANGNGATTSAQPTALTDGVNSVSISPEVDNASYDFSVVTGSTATVRTATEDSANWTTNNTTPFVAQDGDFFNQQALPQTTLGLGDLAFINYNSDATTPGSQQFGLVTFSSVVPGTQVSFTDRGWTTGSGFSNPSADESTVTVTFTQTLSPGEQIYVDNNGNVLNHLKLVLNLLYLQMV